MSELALDPSPPVHPRASTQPAQELEASPEQILDSFSGSVRPVEVEATYRLALGAVAVAMVVLPLLYLGLIGLVGWSVARYADVGRSVFETVSNAKAAVFVYGTPLFVGVVVLVFMVKPLFARRARQAAPLSLSPADEPVLFAFVERLCESVGAPMPTRIDVDCEVNASAGFRRGWLSLLGNDLVLTIGLPLARGLTLEQLAGVLAHEFGHFAQGGGMRLSYVVRSVNAWFARVVYQRDRLDVSLDEAAEGSKNAHVMLYLAVQLARALVWLTRRVLWLLMHAGHAISCYLMRQMEYDADRYEARLVGASTFAKTARELTFLGVGKQVAFGRLEHTWSESGRLVDDVSELVSIERSRLDPKLVRTIDAKRLAERTGAFDTHPADADRIANAERETDRPVFRCELPATALFVDFEALARRASRHHFEQMLEQDLAPEAFLEAQRVMAITEQVVSDRAALDRLVGVPLDLRRVLPWGAADTDASTRSLEHARRAVREGRDDYLKRLASWSEVVDEERRIGYALELLDRKLKFEPQQLGLQKGDRDYVERRRDLLARREASLAEGLRAFEALLVERWRLALGALDRAPSTDDVDDDPRASEERREERDRLLHLARELAASWPIVLEIQRNADQQLFILRLGETVDKPGDRLLELGAELRTALDSLRTAWALPCPFEGGPGESDVLGERVVPQPAADESALEVLQLADRSLDRAYRILEKVRIRLAHLAERGERSLGLEPLFDQNDVTVEEDV